MFHQFLSSSYLVLGSGTEIGKTFLVENLCKKTPNSKAIKPVITGFDDDNFAQSDSAKILRACKLEDSLENISRISPWRYPKPLAPCFAGEVIFSKLVEFCHSQIELAKKENFHLFIESAGGVMTPITKNETFLELAIALKIPVLLVGANYLGAISHLLTAAAALQNAEVEIARIFINQHQGEVVDIADLKSLIYSKTGILATSFEEFF